MNVLLTGASGFLGRNILAALSHAGHRVTPVSRRHGIDMCGMLTPDDWKPYLKDIDAVINCVGIIGETASQRFDTLHRLAPIALFNACMQTGVKRVIQISSVGVDDKAFSLFHRSRLVADDMLRSLDIDWFVLRPSLIYGKGGTSATMFMRLAALPLIPVIDDGQQPLQPIHISDVVAVILEALTTAKVRKTLDIVGSETITYAEWLQTMRKAQGVSRARLIHIPGAVALVMLRLARHFHPMLHPDNLRMLQTNYLCAVEPLAEFLGYLPKPVETGLFFSDVASTERKS